MTAEVSVINELLPSLQTYNRCRGEKKVQEGNDQEKEQSERNPNSENRSGKKTTKLAIRYLY